MDEKNEKTILDEEIDEAVEPEILEIIDEEDHADSDHETSEGNTIEKLTSELVALMQEKNESSERNLRLQAEYDNFKKRTQKEKIADRKYKSQDLATELLPALDNFERALQIEITEEAKGIIEGITMVYNQINEALKTEGIETIETVGKEFDPNLHHAVMQVEDSAYEKNIIVEELQKGYILKDRVIRPAMVKVNI